MGSEPLLTLLLAAFLMGAKPPTVSPLWLGKRTATRLLIHQVIPEYPPVARINYIQGRVELQFVVNPQGSVGAVRVLKGEALLAAAALKAVKQWRYRPYIGTQGPVSFETRVQVRFALRVWKLGRLPSHPERYLARQVHPPRVVHAPAFASKERRIPVRVLVGEKGNVLDAEPLRQGEGDLCLIRSKLRHWRFKPAHWGNLAVPWYLDVNVPAPQNVDAHLPSSSLK